MVESTVSDQELDRLGKAIAEQIMAKYPQKRRNASRNGFKIVIHVHNGHKQAHIEWPPETTGIGIEAK